MSISWVSSICVWFISLMQLVSGAKFLNVPFLLVLFTGAPATVVSET